jgi:ATP-binding cassette subfamily B protein
VGILLIAATGLLRDYFYAQVSANILRDIRNQLFERLQHLSMNFYAKIRSGDILAHFSSDMAVIENTTVTAASWALLPGLEVLSNAILLFVLDWRLALLAMLLCPLIILTPKKLAPLTAAETYKRKGEEANMLVFVQENLQTQPVVKIFGLAHLVIAHFKKINERLKERMIRVGFFSALIERTAGVSILFLQIIILGAGTYMVYCKTLSIGSLASFQAIFLGLSYSLSYVMQYIPSLIQASAGARRIQELLSKEPAIKDKTTALALKPLSRDMVFHAVTFGYSDEQINLDQISFSIPKGSTVAFVGASGSGKSTILKLITRSYDPLQGAVTIDDVDLRDAAIATLHRQIGYVFQDSFLLNISLRENIALGKLDASEEEIIAAAVAAEIHDMIMEMPQGYETLAGESGSQLSGGQKQRIAIARALLRKPEILILDEPTSALDPATEFAINKTLKRIAAQHTCLIVTHRLDSIAHAQKIFLLERGKLREQGTHAELLALNGIYKNFWEKQRGFTLDTENNLAAVTADRLCLIPLFNTLDHELLAECANRFRTEQSPADRIIAREGDIGNLFYIIVHGKVEVTKKRVDGLPQQITVLQDGDHFGEIALLKNVPRMATVRTLIPCIFLTLQKNEFTYLLRKMPDLQEKLEKIIQERM